MPWFPKVPDLKNNPLYLEPRVTAAETSLAQKANQHWVDVTAPPYNAKGNGIVDDTQAIQNAIDSITSGIIYIPPGTYKFTTCTSGGNPVYGFNVQEKHDFKIIGYGATIQNATSGSGATIGIHIMGTLTNVTIEGLTITGSGLIADNHVGINSPFGTLNAKNLRIINNRVLNCITGIDVNGESGTQPGGNLNDIIIEGNYIENMVGVEPGYGYGIHISDQVGAWSNAKITGNTLVGCQRHSIYHAQGGGNTIIGNTIKDHRKGVGGTGSSGNDAPALSISRSQGVSVIGNTFDNYWDCAIDVYTDNNKPSKNTIITGNVFMNPQNACSVSLGSLSPNTTGTVENVIVSNNVFYQDGTGIGAVNGINIQSGLRVKITNNSFTMINAASLVRIINLYGSGDGSGTSTYSDNIDIENNTFFGTNGTGGTTIGIHMESSICTAISKMRFANNIFNLPNATLDESVAITNPNIELFGQKYDGIAFNGANYFKAMPIGNLQVANGASGTLTTSNGKTVTVTSGIITSIV